MSYLFKKLFTRRTYNFKKDYIPYGKQTIDHEDIKNVVNVLKSDFLTQGPKIPEFEKQISSFVGSKYSVAVNSATSALHIACKALGLNEGDYLWTSPITFVASANCARYCGAQVDFVDINISNGLICTEKLEEKLELAKKTNMLPKIIVPVHLSGASCEMKKIYELSIKYNFKIIEDASHAIGGTYENERVGICRYSDITIFSFHPVKIITTGEGGIAVTNNLNLFEKMQLLRSHGISKDPKCFVNNSQGSWYYEQKCLGYNYRITDIAATLGISQLKKINQFIDKRKDIYEYYKKNITLPQLRFLDIGNNVKSSHHLTIVRLINKDNDFHKYIFEELRKRKIGVQLHYIPVHLQPYYQSLGFKSGDFPISEKYASSAFSLPNYPNLKKEEISYICKQITEIITMKK